MAKNCLSIFRDEGAITLSGKTARFRRVQHSTSNWVQAKRTNKKRTNAASLGKTLATDGANLAFTATNIFIVATGGAAVGAGAVITSPAVSIVAGVIGLAFFVYSKYSNRDDAHAKLTPYVYSLIDDIPPTVNIYTNPDALKEAAAAAAYLMKEAPSQYKLIAEKLKIRENTFTEFWSAYNKKIYLLTDKGWAYTQDKIDQFNRILGPTSDLALKQLTEYHDMLNKAKVESDEMWVRQSKQGGAVFEYMRRLVKLGNYLQCAEIVSTATYGKLDIAEVVDSGDPFKNWQPANNFRSHLQDISDIKEQVEVNYKKWEEFAKTNGII